MPLTEAEREAAFMRYVELSEPYFAAVGAAGDKPWFDSIDERRELFYRRYTRPAPPVGLSIPRFGSVRHAKPLSPTPAIDDTDQETAAA